MLNAKKKRKLNKLLLLGIFLLIFEKINEILVHRFSVIQNYGISFGMESRWFGIINIFLILFLSWYWFKENFDNWGIFGLLIGGWINLITRLKFGFVPDYWYFFGLYNNLADWIIGIGILIFLMEEVWKRKQK